MAVIEKDIGVIQTEILPAEIPVIDPEDKARIVATSEKHALRESLGRSEVANRTYESFLRTAWGGPEKRVVGYRYADHYNLPPKD